MDEISKIIENTPLKGMIPKSYHSQLTILTLSYGEYLHYSEKESDSIFYLIDGVIQFRQTTEDGIDLNYGVLDGFYFIGERKLLFDNIGETDLYTLRDSTTILKIPIKVAEELLKNKKFKIYMLELHSNKMYKLAVDMSILHFMGVEKFLAYNVLKYSVDGIFKFKSISYLSILLSVDRKSLYNALKNLKSKDILKREKNVIEIIDKERLEEYIRF